ncbi:MAG: hypothetical protein Ct9H300mP30_4420 [Methanobacteriota archaeon]|nr:MAG: hypothetical protein Ct9H300mP30_4420 [Euryarchaeota archaeon]
MFAHNVECVPRLDSVVRDPRASFEQSLPSSGRRAGCARTSDQIQIMVGPGETDEEVTQAMRMLREAGVSMITLGQYLQPGDRHLPLTGSPGPAQFQRWDREPGWVLMLWPAGRWCAQATGRAYFGRNPRRTAGAARRAGVM